MLCVNGEELAADKEGSIDRLFRSYDLSTVIRIGKNELVFRLDYYQSEHVYDVFEDKFVTRLNKTGPMINCLSYITDIENVYLRGKFCVESENEYLPLGKTMLSNDGGFALTLPRRYITLNRLCEDGFPFFGGSIRFKTVINAAGGEKYLKLNGRYACARISVNGAAEHLIMLDDKADVSGELRRGANEVIITLTNSLRNVLGDFHLSRDSEPRFRGPNDYARYGSWIEGKSPSYAERYAFAYFGLDAIELM